MKKHYQISLALSVVITLGYIICSDYIAFPWMDEIGTVDSAANFVENGKWYSHVWQYTYPPLYGLWMIIWFMIFGVSHMSSCASEIVLALGSFIYFQILFNKHAIFNKPIQIYLFCLLFWFGSYFSRIITMGRMDMMVMLLTIPIIDGIVSSDIKICRIILASALMAFSSLYTLPIIAFFVMYICVISRKEYKRMMFYKGCCVAAGFVVGLLATIAFHYFAGTLSAFLNDTFQMQKLDSVQYSLLHRIKMAYTDRAAIALLLVSVLFYVLGGKFGSNLHILIFVAFIPMVMVICGRYSMYYWWLFYIPVVICFCRSFNTVRYEKGVYVLGLVVSFFAVVSGVKMKYDDYRNNINDLRICKDVIRNNCEFIEGKNCVIINPKLYYLLRENSSETYFYWSPALLKRLISTNNNQWLMFPEKGLVITTNGEQYGAIIDFFDNKFITCSKEYDNLGYRILSFPVSE